MATVALPRGSRAGCLPSPAPALLRPPPLRPGLIERPRLAARLDALARGPLTLLSAPTGYGKTTLLAQWAAEGAHPPAWASLGAEQREPARFWQLVGGALAHADPRLGVQVDVVAALPAEEQARVLARWLRALDHELVLVLDGYEAVVDGPVEPSLERLLELVPETFHLVLATRREPQLGLALRRARGALGELRVHDLGFAPAETAAVVARTAGTAAAADALAELDARTEGWPAGAYLAALAARGFARPDETLAGFSGASRDVGDYLRAELLDAQPDDDTRDFLLRSSVLEILSAPLCDRLLRREDSQATLERLARDGAFLVPLDDLGLEFRYQRTVAEFLRVELARRAEEALPALHRRAAVVCERAGLLDEAEAHVLVAGGRSEPVDVLGRHALELVRGGRIELFQRLLSTRSGAALVRRRPALEQELRALHAARADMEALLAASERVAALCTGLPGGPVTTLARASALAARGYALLLGGRPAEAYEACSVRQSWPVAEAPAAAAQAAAVAALAAGRLGLWAPAAPLARASAAALRSGGVRTGLPAALAALAEAAVLERQGEAGLAADRCAAAADAATPDPPARALALLELARLRAEEDLAGARAGLAEARGELEHCAGAALAEALADGVAARLAARDRRRPPHRELSPAEQRVLRLLASSLTQREIASELYLSANTVKTHTRVIYRKLDVSSRGEAVRAARELNLV